MNGTLAENLKGNNKINLVQSIIVTTLAIVGNHNTLETKISKRTNISIFNYWFNF